MIPQKRVGQVEDIGKAAVWLSRAYENFGFANQIDSINVMTINDNKYFNHYYFGDSLILFREHDPYLTNILKDNSGPNAYKLVVEDDTFLIKREFQLNELKTFQRIVH